MDNFISWVLENWIEITAAILGLIGIFLQIKQNPWYWLTSIIMVILYMFVFFQSKFYADMSFQFYYLIVSIYGWYYWIKHKNVKDSSEIQTTNLNLKGWLISIFSSAIFFILIYLILNHLTDSDVAMGDALTTSLSIVATWLLARKILENWIFWIIVDFISTALYIYKGLYPTAILFSVLTILAVYGYFKWKKTLKNV